MIDSMIQNSIIPFPTAKNDSQGIIYDPPLGIPDPSVECPEGPDNRKRVRRDGNVPSLCFFVAIQHLKKYIGPLFCSTLKHLEPFENALNQMLKEQAAHESTINTINGLWYGVNNLKSCKKSEIEKRIITLQN